MNIQLSDIAATHSIHGKAAPVGMLKRIRLELARSNEFRSGSARHGFEFVAPLDGNRYIDLQQWRQLQDFCTVRKFWDDAEQLGCLVYKPGENEHAFWAIYCEQDTIVGDEPCYRFGSQSFVPGDFVTIKGRNGEQCIFRVTSVSERR